MSISREVQNFLLQNKDEILSFFKSTDSKYIEIGSPENSIIEKESLSSDDVNQCSEIEDTRFGGAVGNYQNCLFSSSNFYLPVNSTFTSSNFEVDLKRTHYQVSNGSKSKIPRRNHSSKWSSSDCEKPCRCVGIFGMSRFTDERDLLSIFSRFGRIEKINIVRDRYNQRSRGFGFVYLRTTKEAQNAVRSLVGTTIDGHKVRIDYSYSKENLHQ